MSQKLETCRTCNGDGWVEYAVKGGSWPWERDDCEDCGGSGEIEIEKDEDE